MITGVRSATQNSPSVEEKSERLTHAFLKAKRNIDRSRERMMDKHNQLVDQSQKKLAVLIQKKRLEKEIEQAQDTRSFLNAQALAERLKHREILQQED